MKKLLIPIIFLLACGKAEDKPAGLLTKEQMINILTDIHITEAKVSRMSFRSYDSTQIVYKEFENDIFKKYKTDSVVYRQSYNYYLEHMAEMDEIYTAIVDTLTLRESLGKIEWVIKSE